MNVLVVEDNQEVAEFIKDILEEDGDIRVEIRNPVVNPAPIETPVDFILLDEDLNGQSGLKFLETFRAQRSGFRGPVIMVTGCDDEKVIKDAFGRGVDDYVLKPFKPSVLKGKVRALCHRCGYFLNTLKAGALEIEVDQHKVSVNADPVTLTLTEYKILKELVMNLGSIVTRETLKANVFGGAHVTNRALDVHICALRKKLRQMGDPVKTIRGVGYRMLVTTEAAAVS